MAASTLTPISTSTSSDTQTMVNALIVDILQGDKPKTTKDAKKLYSVLIKLLAHWVVEELPETEKTVVKAGLLLEEEVVGCMSSCCLPRRR